MEMGADKGRMLARFHDKRVLRDAVQKQQFVGGISTLAEELTAIGKLEEWSTGQKMITQGAPDRDLFLILVGQVSVAINGREIALRTAGQHVGEMSLFDPSAVRSASVIAREQSVTLRISEADFTRIAEGHPNAWRRLASEIADRLRQRTRFIRTRNATPIVFVGSSTESRAIVTAIAEELSHDPFIVRSWSDGVFGASHFPLDDLKRQLDESDFAVLVIGPDDKVMSRGRRYQAPRDNIIFELGLFMGALGRERVFIAQERGRSIKVPSDLLGLGTIRFDADARPFYKLLRQQGTSAPLAIRIVEACNIIREKVRELGSR
jgi:CRP/FNR family transcriptional regulator, cyclic AMP receptor protein